MFHQKKASSVVANVKYANASQAMAEAEASAAQGRSTRTRGARNPQPTIIPYPSEPMGPNRRMANFERTEYRAQTIPLSSR